MQQALKKVRLVCCSLAGVGTPQSRLWRAPCPRRKRALDTKISITPFRSLPDSCSIYLDGTAVCSVLWSGVGQAIVPQWPVFFRLRDKRATICPVISSTLDWPVTKARAGWVMLPEADRSRADPIYPKSSYLHRAPRLAANSNPQHPDSAPGARANLESKSCTQMATEQQIAANRRKPSTAHRPPPMKEKPGTNSAMRSSRASPPRPASSTNSPTPSPRTTGA